MGLPGPLVPSVPLNPHVSPHLLHQLPHRLLPERRTPPRHHLVLKLRAPAQTLSRCLLPAQPSRQIPESLDALVHSDGPERVQIPREGAIPTVLNQAWPDPEERREVLPHWPPGLEALPLTPFGGDSNADEDIGGGQEARSVLRVCTAETCGRAWRAEVQRHRRTDGVGSASEAKLASGPGGVWEGAVMESKRGKDNRK